MNKGRERGLLVRRNCVLCDILVWNVMVGWIKEGQFRTMWLSGLTGGLERQCYQGVSPAGGSRLAHAGVGGQGEVGSREGWCGQSVEGGPEEGEMYSRERVLWQCVCPWGVGAETSGHLDLRSSQGWLSHHPEVSSCQSYCLWKYLPWHFPK